MSGMDAGLIFVVMEDDKNPLGMDAGLIFAVMEDG
jgi:hypothetical protein